MSEMIAKAKGKYDAEDFQITIFSAEHKFHESNEYHCQIVIEGKGIKYKDKVIGFDSMQALILALKTIGSFIVDNDDFNPSLLEWDGGPMDFPTFTIYK